VISNVGYQPKGSVLVASMSACPTEDEDSFNITDDTSSGAAFAQERESKRQNVEGSPLCMQICTPGAGSVASRRSQETSVSDIDIAEAEVEVREQLAELAAAKLQRLRAIKGASAGSRSSTSAARGNPAVKASPTRPPESSLSDDLSDIMDAPGLETQRLNQEWLCREAIARHQNELERAQAQQAIEARHQYLMHEQRQALEEREATLRREVHASQDEARAVAAASMMSEQAVAQQATNIVGFSKRHGRGSTSRRTCCPRGR